jgi:hypothetical protein
MVPNFVIRAGSPPDGLGGKTGPLISPSICAKIGDFVEDIPGAFW